MNKLHLIERIKNTHGNSFTAVEAVEVVLETMVRTLAEGDKVIITGFGTLEPVLMDTRKARNPQTGETMWVPPVHKVRWRAGQNLIDLVNGRKLLPAEGGECSAIKKAPKTPRVK